MRRFLFLSAVFTAIALAQTTNPLNMTAMQVVKDMGLGINLGNTFEAAPCNSNVTSCETSWGSPKITKAMIDGYASSGFKTVRIPVAWSNLMTGNNNGGNYTISTALLDRVEQVVNWVLENNMYAIVNIHWDGGWWSRFPNDSAECMKKYGRIWEQVSAKFKNHSGYLVFESLNEEGVWNDVWYVWGSNANDMTAKARAYGILNAINKKFTDLVRASGSNNADRHLLIAGYETNIDRTIDAMFKMPTDPKSNHQAVSVHYYDPFGFTHLEKDESWATMTTTWGTQAEINQLNTEMNKMKTAFVDKGIPVIVGEYGMATKGRAESEIRKYTLAVAEAVYTRNMCPVLWDVQLNASETQYYYNRNRNPPGFVDQQLVTGFKNIVGVSSSSSSRPPSSSSVAPSSSSSRPSSSSVAPSSSSSRPSSSSVAPSSSSSRPSSSSVAPSSSSSRPSSSSILPSSSSLRISSSSSRQNSSSSVRSSSSGTTPVILSQPLVAGNALNAMHNAVNLQAVENITLQVFDLNGNVIRTMRFASGNYIVPLGDLPKGMYIVGMQRASVRVVVR